MQMNSGTVSVLLLFCVPYAGRLGDAAPTLLLIRDKGGAVFGGIAHQPWKKTGTFYGKWTQLLCR